MKETEEGYAQIEKEALAILFGCTKFEHYIYGKRINVQTDHKPLETIYKKPISKAPKRLQRIMLAKQHFNLNVRYVPGKYVVLADALSRDFQPQTEDYSSLKEEIWQVKEIRSFLAMQPTTIDLLEKRSKDDGEMQQLKKLIQIGWPNDKSKVQPAVVPYFNIRDELSVEGDLVFKGEQVVVPKPMRKLLSLIHI